ncbi:unnamed protein product [Phytophthora fragariaefolia]|uniref:Unnamed protein product n=1 Tax=Phytophthora fragariaefolia TaxID=1490495 RepID=A0A9W6U4V1_9STRA|nr:unnamed protein product [Phytophthora fragariaefolia]
MNVFSLLDGFRYKEFPQKLWPFDLPAISQLVDLKSGERMGAYCCMLPCWSKKDFWSLGRLIHEFDDDEMETRFYYSGGSARDFTLASPDALREVVDAATDNTENVSRLLYPNLTGTSQMNRLRRSFVGNASDTAQSLSTVLGECHRFRIRSSYNLLQTTPSGSVSHLCLGTKNGTHITRWMCC